MGVVTTAGAEPRSDAALLGAVAGGDLGALRELYERHAPWLALRLTRRAPDPGLVEEVVQDTFVAVWRGAVGYRGQGDVGAWIWGIGIRRLLDRLRRAEPASLGSRTREGCAASAEEQALLGIEHGDLGTALTQLPPELQAVLQATVLEGMTSKEAATVLGIPQGTVKTRLMRAKARLREALA